MALRPPGGGLTFAYDAEQARSGKSGMKPKACVILPTYNEAENVKHVISSIFEQTKKIVSHSLHVLVVDDNSPDGTQDVVRELMNQFPNLDLITGQKKGLGEAYKRGMEHAIQRLSPDLIFEMDADGQHDPGLIPLFIVMANHGFSLVIGSRFAPGGATPSFSVRRRMISLAGNWMVRFLGGLPRIHDCTSGFRCIKAELIKKCNLRFLSTRGYSFQSSLLFELLRNGARVIEIPIVFPERLHGQSKLSLRDQFEFVLNIAKIRFRQSEEFMKYCVVGFSGIFVNLGVYVLLTRVFNVYGALASPIAIELSILSNFFMNDFWTFGKRRNGLPLHERLFRFHAVAGLAGILNYLTFLVSAYVFQLYDILSTFTGIIVATLLNYSLNSLWTWKKTPPDSD
ncbi:MAG: glycosyltransferase family 2 protein [Syntrophorhabdales bacterium]|jgi:dolichol-phosphate mannosyltransferase